MDKHLFKLIGSIAEVDHIRILAASTSLSLAMPGHVIHRHSQSQLSQHEMDNRPQSGEL